ncbi:hypothetical protein V8E53_014191 [Lactarius tabidus]
MAKLKPTPPPDTWRWVTGNCEFGLLSSHHSASCVYGMTISIANLIDNPQPTCACSSSLDEPDLTQFRAYSWKLGLIVIFPLAGIHPLMKRVAYYWPPTWLIMWRPPPDSAHTRTAPSLVRPGGQRDLPRVLERDPCTTPYCVRGSYVWLVVMQFTRDRISAATCSRREIYSAVIWITRHLLGGGRGIEQLRHLLYSCCWGRSHPLGYANSKPRRQRPEELPRRSEIVWGGLFVDYVLG